MDTHVCNDCKVSKPLTEYYRHQKNYCKECLKARALDYQRRNKDKRKVICERYYENHKDQIKANQIEYHLSPVVKNDRAAKAKVYRKRNSVQRAEYSREWFARNPERAREKYIRDTQRRKARVAGVEIENFNRSEIFIRDNGMCRYCGITLKPDKWHLDHVVPIVRGGPHTKANTVASCTRCNLVKNDKLIEELGWVL